MYFSSSDNIHENKIASHSDTNEHNQISRSPQIKFHFNTYVW